MTSTRPDAPTSPWFHRAGSAAQGDWMLDLGTPDSTTEVPGWKHTGLRVADLGAGQTIALDAQEEERIVVPLSGAFTVEVDGHRYELAGRTSVFHGPTDVLYTGIRRAATVSSAGGGRVAVASAPATAEHPVRHLPAADIPLELRGAGVCSRQVHNFGTPATLEADRFIVCEVLTPAGNWSSYPPHKHDEEAEGETALEEIYYFEMQTAQDMPVPSPAEGGPDAMGYQRVYASDEREIDVTAEVRSGDVVLVPYGWHGPAMTPPGHDMYYLNVMAGPGPVRQWLISDDPHHGWIRKTWEGQDLDSRLPFSG
ncbi:5-deoxy-glucuronate isomerase [Nesterenkonia xinjiangensis]|uniref:5-deoxy-glucuronate isomerase n=1 Tax=Nesterenkonia xinjiangensis TaxID=225327 RepID=A0A7Z0GMS4_9MICC|nr:5-deoxy-glucuronate isomerase [Nesterenkonia xinjiangensis]NYJ78775.1 5-deoxy-glucuronate isomerase [Nesterenkonia xinjiangensis]